MIIEEKVISIVSEVLGIESEKITSADTFDDLYIDSLDLVEIIIECEQEFGYPIKDDKVQNLKTVEDLVNLIKDLDNKDYLESTQTDLHYLYDDKLTKEQKYLFSEMNAAIEKIVDSYIIEGYSEKEAKKLTYDKVMTIISRKLCDKF